ncbi:hypothetical protein [Serratia fonticola]
MTISKERLNILQQTFKATAKGSEALEAAALNDAAAAISELLAVREAQPVVEVKPYGYLRENNGKVQISIGPERPADRASGYATPWGAVYAAPPAPAVPDEKTFEQIAQETDDGIGGYSIRDCVVAAHWWNACRAAMLQPVSQGYTLPAGCKLVPVEPTEDMIAAAMMCDDVEFNSDETFCVNFGNIYRAMLAAAPTPTK